ncbi:hypothetical protein [Fibrobacter sp.]|nr:hypothetical protein [Fibrobacter sp.]MBR4008982.1 hypothetical protein [Fibrobacter sp.]
MGLPAERNEPDGDCEIDGEMPAGEMHAGSALVEICPQASLQNEMPAG